MGYLQATEMANLLDLEQGVTWQLRSNHYPPVPLEMISVAVLAVELCLEGDYTATVRTPFEHRVYGYDVPAHVIIDCYHLEPWCS